ncbi:MAG: N-acetyl-gamma-glutamyl-phosphate reductase [Ardenticatenales bacterium]|nr:N-acetyl-gamma-glutamyl-phosphate reductase [Ardenticatenales bacterium]
MHGAVYGATGYTGSELIGLLVRHPGVELRFAVSSSGAGRSLADVVPGAPDVPLVAADAVLTDGLDVAFLCLPHGAAAETALRLLDAGVRVIDLSADFRLPDADLYAAWYNRAHPSPAHLAGAVYGLTEHARGALPRASLVANPGCYPTSVLLPLVPLVRAGAVATGAVIVADSKSGISGAGRVPLLHTSFVEVAGNFKAYSVGRSHRHLPEMEVQLARLVGRSIAPPPLIFTPHLLPVPRGILSTLYVPLAPGFDLAAVRTALTDAYAAEPFVTVLPPGEQVQLAHVVRTNRCAISLEVCQPPDSAAMLIVTSAIDNLVKGAAGQAVQNMNAVFGLPETTGLLG